jgi:hypothetical protein
LCQTFFSCHTNRIQPLIHVPNKQAKMISIILVLLDVVKEPIEWLTFLLVRIRNNSYHLILLAPNLLFMSQQWQLTFASCPKQISNASLKHNEHPMHAS